ncbi:DUF6071 family protein [Streptomyces hoynatensis]|uniref:SGNH/GDSL hydrolase family protein n=1 Tax=Streptomyces hoynatensis TaxID=1141874 RepID=A0A3A9Z9U0_9ACTN|nr:DUF6071 family protein [Streptomyces hoynatensis]RKN44899.1 hypothetical protein D7294_07265 [Streptomyces hoynatensis]
MAAASPVRLLVVNGCSMTFGDELPNRLETCWGALLARRLGADFVNLGACAGSNHRMMRLTVERLGGYTAERGLRPDEVLFLGMWSRINRFEVFAGEPDRQGGLPDIPDPGWCRLHPTYIDRHDRRSTVWYKELQHDSGDRVEFLLQWVLLDSWLARNGYRYGFLWAFDPDPTIFEELRPYSEQIDLSRVIGSDRFPYGGPSVFSVGKALGDLGPYRHPLVRSQEVFVEEYVDGWVRDLLRREPSAPSPARRRGA